MKKWGQLSLFGIFFWIIFQASAAFAASFYVSAGTGSDSYSGLSPSTPFKTIQRAANSVAPGDVVNVMDGVYREAIHISRSGTSSARITFKSVNKWGAKITGLASSAITVEIASQYIDFVNFDITDVCTQAASRYAVRTLSSHINLTGNYIHDVPRYSCDYGAVGIDISGYSTTSVPTDVNAYRNVIYRMGNPSECSTRKRGYGIYVAINGGTIQNNIIYGNGAYGVHYWHAASNYVVSNNTIFANGRAGILIGMGDSPYLGSGTCTGHVTDYSHIHNNIIVNNAENGIVEYDSFGGICIGSHNSYVNNLLFNNPQGNLKLYAGHTASGTVAADPQFVNPQMNYSFTIGDYHLKSTSPAIDKGTSAFAASTDFDLTNRPAGLGYDIGAYEFKTSLSSTASPSPTSVPVTSSPSPSPSPAPTSYTTLFSSSTTPASITAGSANPVELGVKFKSSVAGRILGIRFYMGASNPGPHTVNLWTSSGTLLARSVLTGYHTPGWQTVYFAAPVTISAGTLYVASYFAPAGGWSANFYYFSTAGKSSGPLYAPSKSETGNGVYAYSTTTAFPNTVPAAATNYWVDVMFTPL